MFRKVSKKPKIIKATNVRRHLEEEEDDDQEQERIQETVKKHKFLASLPMASGDDRPKKRRFLVSSTFEEGNDGEDPNHDLTVLDLKHKQAMDEYIRGQLKAATTNDNNYHISTTQQEEGEEQAQQQQPNVDAETLLYLELAAAAVPSKVLAQDNEDDAKGAAMLVGGTGIAEVILPKTTKFDNPTPTGVRYSRNPKVSSAVTDLKDNVGVDNNLLPAGFRSMVPDKVSHEEPVPTRPLPDGQGATTTDELVDTPAAVDDNRPGFAALVHHKNRGKMTRSGTSSTNAPSSKPRGHQYEKDQQAFSKFVKRQRDGRR